MGNKASEPKDVTVIVTSYNQRNYLCRAIESVLRQTAQPHIIISDDYSTDGSQELILKYADKFPRIIRPYLHSQNMGVSRNRKFALSRVRTKLVTTLDGDDWYHPRKIEYELKLYNRSQWAQIIYSNYFLVNEKGKIIWVRYKSPFQPKGNLFLKVVSRSYPLMRDMMVETRCFKDVGNFDENLSLYEDWDIKIRLTKYYNADYCHRPLIYHRKHDAGLSNQSPNNHFIAMRYILQKNMELLDDLPTRRRERIFKKMDALLAVMEGTTKLSENYATEFMLNFWNATKLDPLNKMHYYNMIVQLARKIRNRSKRYRKESPKP